ncbi:helix-turn-helix domain-containing protein [Flavobacterium sp. MFBS3-15]|uniref:helix-turn-helix domain-containing protein n=1 Tax=Flavobacterium sp. MFBS3-15 TaxID=2989816 RepID=UPI002236A0EC|nr:helix-turn-helix domain-containing protein [Flavobacterium sp. MFBS3-15]MCW4469823.1 helix-turn-helix domain-containing protein [Flavobacterium sp. MFBS3-15]
MEDGVTKEDLRQFGLLLIGTIRNIIQAGGDARKETVHPEWLKSRVVRKLLDISPGSLQNLRITGKIRFKKVLGSYYYNRDDIMQLFDDDKGSNAGK